MKVPIAIATATALAAILALGFGGCGGAAGPVDGARARAHTARIVECGPRPPGSKGIRDVEGYIRSRLEELGLELQVQAFRAPPKARAGDIEFRNLWVEIEGADPDGPILAIGAHYDSKITDAAHDFEFVGALDAAAACGLLLELARALKAETPIAPNVWLIWFDGEESLEWDWNEDRALIGSRHFVATMSADKERFPNGLGSRMKVFVLLDLIGSENQKIDRDTTGSDPRLMDLFKEVADAMGEGERMYRYDSPMTDDHVPFKPHSVKTIDLIDFRYRVPEHHVPGMPEEAKQYEAWWHTPNDTIDKVSVASLDFVGSLVWNALPVIEQRFYR